MGAANEIGSYKDGCQHNNDGNQRLLAVYRPGVDTVQESRERPIDGLQHMRQPDEREQRSSENGKGGKQSEVAQQVGMDKQQS